MKKILVSLFIVLSFSHATVLPENTVAVVNGTAIIQEELNYTVEKLLPRISFHTNLKKAKTDELIKKALDELININIFYTYGLSQGFKPKQEDLDTRKKELLKAANNSRAQLDIYFQKKRTSFDLYMHAFKKELVLAQVYEKNIKSVPTEKELKEYYKNNKHKFKMPERINIKMIYIKNNPMDPIGNKKAKKKADEALAKIKSGTSFEEVAEKYSSDRSRVKGGNLGFMHKGQITASIEEEVFKMKPGELSEVMERGLGCYIVEVIEKGEAKQLPFSKIKDNLKKDLQTKEEKIKRDELLEKLKKKAKIIK
ncbi:peptidylprolyl isomerase [Candidatus Sulfurimonas marisnigri]|uniref:peptidylprolyl isomerase n=1 Tax=Candidatus Sulfurimonas marisnigri TaxID=2740405 RepID=A0A7S7LZU1_9BACT|nr:peptidylprolyl isomerase [Candidatus Sulfurimonas marisnigri]QOY54444.1 peptidylprolyl isomerase [Candidatus Sulfurimonas marisnigri]